MFGRARVFRGRLGARVCVFALCILTKKKPDEAQCVVSQVYFCERVKSNARAGRVASSGFSVVVWRAAPQESERSRSSVFTTTADAGQQQAQAKSAYFFESTRKVHFFEEAGETPALNKAGHGLHLADDVFGRYSTSPRIASLLRALGLRDAVLPQSMYIFKPPRVGGAVTSHQDATFLRTTPAQTVIGLWLALDDATLENGCLWVRNASHLEPVRRYFVREKTGAAGVEMRFVPVDAEDRGAYLSERLLAAGVSVQPPAAREVEGREMGAAEAASQGFLPVPVRAGTLLVRLFGVPTTGIDLGILRSILRYRVVETGVWVSDDLESSERARSVGDFPAHYIDRPNRTRSG